MKCRLLILITCLCFLFTGCTVTSDRIYTVCRVSGDNVYVYNGNSDFFLYKSGKLISCPRGDLQPKPKLCLDLPEETDFHFVKEMPSVYQASLNDVLRYVSKVMQETSAEVACPEVDWKSFTAYLRNSDFDMKVYYSSDNKVRVYMNDSEGNAVTPLYLE